MNILSFFFQRFQTVFSNFSVYNALSSVSIDLRSEFLMSDIDLQDKGRTLNSFTCIESRVMCSLKLVKVLFKSIVNYFKVNNKQNLTVSCVLHFKKKYSIYSEV